MCSPAAAPSSDVPAAALLLTTTISSTTPVAAKSRMAARIESRSLYVGNTTEMRLPRHGTSASLSAEAPREALARDEALLAQVGDAPLVRWYMVTSPALVLGLALHHRRQEVVDFEHCRAAGVEVLDRAAGGGAVLLDQGMLCCTVATPNPESDLTESYRWLGVHFAQRLGLRRVEVAEARADVAALREAKADLVLNACYGALSPHEVVDQQGAKV